MIKFFRRIRQNLLAENRFSKYLLYAIGEILLVVVGILIALQVNNWNESRQHNELQVKYLKYIKGELVNNQSLMERIVINRFDRKMEGLKKAKLYAINKYTVELNVRYYVSDYQQFVNGLKEFDRNHPDNISIDDQPFMMKKLKSEETIMKVNREITYGIQVNSLVNGINRRTKDLISNIDQELENLE